MKLKPAEEDLGILEHRQIESQESEEIQTPKLFTH